MKFRHRLEVWMLGAFAAAAVGVLALATITWRVALQSHEAGRQVTHTYEVLQRLISIQGDTIQIEFSTQSFRVTGDPARLVERDASIAHREALLSEVGKLILDNAYQRQRWVQLREVIDLRLQISRQVEALRKTEGQDAANAYVQRAPLQETRQRTQQLLQAMQVEERRLLDMRNEALEQLRQQLLLSGGVASALLLVLLLATYLLLQRQLHDLRQSRQALAESEQGLAITLRSIGDGVVATDTQGRVTRMNPVAEQLSGWTLAQARGHAAQEVLRVINELTRQPVELPIAQVLATGEVKELANHTTLIARDGTELPIADSAAPIRDDEGQLHGVVLVFRDETLARQAKANIEEQNLLLESRVQERTAQLQQSEQQLARVLAGSEQGFWEWDLLSNRFQLSPRCETMLGFSPGEIVADPANWPQLVHPDDYPVTMASIQRHLRGEAASHDVDIRCRTKEGGWRWVQTRGGVVKRTPQGEPWIMAGTHTDITQRKLQEQAKREADVVFENSYEGIMVANAEGLITKVNPAFTRITGYSQEEIQGRSPSVLSSGRHDVQFYRDFWAELLQKDFWRGEIWNRRKSGEAYAALQSISVVRNSSREVEHFVSVFTDITQLKAHEAELDHVAHYDALTDLPNRRLLSDRLRQSILRAQRNGKLTAVCFLDLDGFKLINDQLGHAVGDQLLVGIAQHLQSVLRAEDTLARLGGDEFVLLLSEIDAPEECHLILDRVLETVRRPVNTTVREISITASIGVSLYPDDNAAPDTLLRHADQAMYLAKQAGKNRYQLFDPAIDRIAQQHREFLTELHQAYANQEFRLFYQPKVDLLSGEIIGVEALIRWQHPQRGLLTPGEFLTHIQGSELERQFGEWVIETALCQLELWAGQALPRQISVNISANHLLQEDFCDQLESALQRHPTIAPEQLELEVLETAAIEDMQHAVDILQRCIALGVRFSLDDFGTGYSSLTYLRKLPVHTLKIDQSFVRDMLVDPDDLGIVRGVIELAETFHRQVLAEGVETLEHGAKLLSMGCRYAQGYGVARPMPAQALPDWCQQWHIQQPWRHLP